MTAGPADHTPGRTGGPTTRLTVVYDEACELCRRCRHWLSTEPAHVRLEFLAAGSPEAKRRYGKLPWYRTELMVVADDGRAWVGPAAFLMCLWATERWRPMSRRLRGRAFGPLVERFFENISANRRTISGMLRPHRCPDDRCGISDDAGPPPPAPLVTTAAPSGAGVDTRPPPPPPPFDRPFDH